MKYNLAACDTALGRPADQTALGCLEAHVQPMEICLDRDDRELSNLCTFEQRNGIKEHDAINSRLPERAGRSAMRATAPSTSFTVGNFLSRRPRDSLFLAVGVHRTRQHRPLSSKMCNTRIDISPPFSCYLSSDEA